MKKLILLLIAVSLSHTYTFSQGCLPKGTTFSYQAQIDSFQVNYPGCTEIEGDVFIFKLNGPTDISNLNGLNKVTSIGGSLQIANNPLLTNLSGMDSLTNIGGQLRIDYNASLVSIYALSNLTSIGHNLAIDDNIVLSSLIGIENIAAIQGDIAIDGNLALSNLEGLSGLTSVGGNLYIGYCSSLTNLTGLESLISIGYGLYVFFNSSLTSLTGINNINGGSIYDLTIYENEYLSQCDVNSICDYLLKQTDTVYIHNNATGCNSPKEVLAACKLGYENVQKTGIAISPNPSSGQFTFELTLQQPLKVNLIVHNSLGQVVEILADGVVASGKHLVSWNAVNHKPGIYYCRLLIGCNPVTNKIVKTH